ncbi:MAG TPA: hypothetical protein DEP01_03150 [Aminobacterium sp.]|nr:hypothetical protein [Aminobacterium sp.]
MQNINRGKTSSPIFLDLDVAKVALLGVPDIPGIAASLFAALAEVVIDVEMIVQSVMRGQVNDIAFLVRKSGLEGAIRVCRAVSMEIDAQGVIFDTEIAKISVSSLPSGKRDFPARVFSALAHQGVNIDMILALPSSVTCVVATAKVEEAFEALKQELGGCE